MIYVIHTLRIDQGYGDCTATTTLHAATTDKAVARKALAHAALGRDWDGEIALSIFYDDNGPPTMEVLTVRDILDAAISGRDLLSD